MHTLSPSAVYRACRCAADIVRWWLGHVKAISLTQYGARSGCAAETKQADQLETRGSQLIFCPQQKRYSILRIATYSMTQKEGYVV